MGHGFLSIQYRNDRDRKEIIMSQAKRYARNQAKARRRRRLNAQERLERDRRQAQQGAEALHQALEELGLPETLVSEIEGRLQSQQKLLGKSSVSCSPPSLAVVRLRSSVGCGDGTRTGLCVCCTLCPNTPGSSGCGVWGWKCWFRFGVMLKAKAKRPKAGGSGPGPSMILSSTSMASSWG